MRFLIFTAETPRAPRNLSKYQDLDRAASAEVPEWNWPPMLMAHFEGATFVGLCGVKARRKTDNSRMRLEDVASGYWTLSAK